MRLRASLVLVSIAGCGSGSTPDGEDGGTGDALPTYGPCDPHLPPCEAMACATDDATRRVLGIFLDVVDAAGASERIRVLGTATTSGYVSVDFVYEWDWVRIWSGVGVTDTDSDAAVRAAIESDLCLGEPGPFVPWQVLESGVHACDPSMRFDACNVTLTYGCGVAYLVDYWTGPVAYCQFLVDRYQMDLVTGEELCELDVTEYCC